MITTADRPSLRWPARLGWTAHLLLRVGLAGYLMVYGWAKIWLTQMGRADYGDALINFGEMSPMGLLWRMVGYSVPFQVLSGVAEVMGAALLLWRRTAGVGAVVAAFDMFFVFLLNMAYDVPVKQLSLALAIGATIAAIPYLTRFLRAGFGSGPILGGPLPTIFTGRLGKITNVLGLIIAIGAVVGSGVLFRVMLPAAVEGHPIAGVYRVVRDRAQPAAQLVDDTRWQQVSFGQWLVDGRARMSIRQAGGDLRTGTYRDSGPNTIMVELDERMLSLRWVDRTGGGIRLTSEEQDVELAPDPERRFLFDRVFSWAPRQPLNR